MKFAAILATIVLGFAFDATAFDLTGTWEGRQFCRSFNGDKVRVLNDPSTLEISQSGSALNLHLDGATLYRGEAVEMIDNTRRGRVGFVHCGTSDALTGRNEMGRVRVNVRPNLVSARVKGFSVLREDVDGVGTCSWSYTRTNTTDPVVPACP